MAESFAAAFVRDHPPECGCGWCPAVADAAETVRRGFDLLAENVASIGCVRFDLAGGTFGADLRFLARLADRLDAQGAAGPGGAVR